MRSSSCLVWLSLFATETMPACLPAARLGAPAKQLQQRPPPDLPYNCKYDVDISQEDEGPVPDDPFGRRTFSVEIMNTSVSGKVLSNVTVSRAVDPRPNDFRHISESECLVNDGDPMTSAQTMVMFKYQSEAGQYPFAVTSASC